MNVRDGNTRGITETTVIGRSNLKLANGGRIMRPSSRVQELAMQKRTTSKHETVLAANPADCLESLEHISASLSCVLSLLEVESERSEACHGIHCLVVMIKLRLDQTAAEHFPPD
jgi:hypothetical protein